VISIDTFPIKKWSAAAALAAAAFYLLLSGAEVATQRSFLMTAVVLIAVMVDRRAVTFRTIAVAALIVLAVAPEALVHPSFDIACLGDVAVAEIAMVVEEDDESRRSEGAGEAFEAMVTRPGIAVRHGDCRAAADAPGGHEEPATQRQAVLAGKGDVAARYLGRHGASDGMSKPLMVIDNRL
jgi:hypothetical protein